jgi:hypothetical protein
LDQSHSFDRLSKALEVRTLLRTCPVPKPGVLTIATPLEPQRFTLTQCEIVALGDAISNHLGERIELALLLTGHRYEPLGTCRLYLTGCEDVSGLQRNMTHVCCAFTPPIEAKIRPRRCWTLPNAAGVPVTVMLADRPDIRT